jgi:hypothetical protein
MSSYPPPLEFVPIFNANLFKNNSDNLTYTAADNRYLIKQGDDTDFGNLTIKKNLYLSNGLVSAPAYSFTNQTNTGIYLAATNDLRIAVNGVDRIQQNTSATQINQPLLLSDGSVSAPAYSFASETSLGFYRAAAGDIRLAQFGLDALTYSGAQFLVNGRQRTTIAGTATNPSIKIGSDDTNMTGLYNSNIYSLTVSVGQQAVADFRNSGGRGVRLYGDTSGNNSNYSPSILGYYMEQSLSLTFKWGATGTSITVPCVLMRIGSHVSFTMQSWGSAIQNTTGSAIGLITTTQIPTCFWPPASSGIQTYTNVSIINGTNTVIMLYVVGGQGYINLAPVSGGWANLTTVNCYGNTFVWSVV